MLTSPNGKKASNEIEEPGGAMAGPPPGLYADDDEYSKDIAAGFPKMKAFIAKKKAERETKKQAS